MHEKQERAAFVRWLKKAHPSVSAARYGKPAQDQYIVPSVQEAWQGWWARSQRVLSVKRSEWQQLSPEAQAKLRAMTGDPGPEYRRQQALGAERARKVQLGDDA